MIVRGPFGGSEPARPDPVGRMDVRREIRPAAGSRRLGFGTLACPRCDAPVAPSGTVSPADPLGCPFCHHGASVRDFLSLSAPTRPARVEVRINLR